MKKPVEKYIKRGTEVESMQVRIDPQVKHEIEIAAKKMNTSLNRFSEAALTWYLDALKKEGSL